MFHRKLDQFITAIHDTIYIQSYLGGKVLLIYILVIYSSVKITWVDIYIVFKITLKLWDGTIHCTVHTSTARFTNSGK